MSLARPSLSADIRTDQRVKFQLGGAIGKMVNMFGGKGAREGVTSMVAVKGNRKATMSDTTGQIIDLTEEKIYDLDIKKKTYTVTTFAELRKQMEEAKRDAEKSAREGRAPAEPSKPAEKDPNAKEFEVDFDMKNTGVSQDHQRLQHQADRDDRSRCVKRARPSNDAGGMVMTTDLWTAPNAPSTKDLADFDMQYAQKLYGPMVVGASAQDMAMAMAMYPQMKPALDKMRAEGSKIAGTAILTDMKMESVPPGTANQTARRAAPRPRSPKKKGLGGMLGGLKKMAEQSEKTASNAKPQRAIIMTTSVEMLKLTTDVDAASVAMPAGFTEKK